jgi:uncharacterized protein (TIGR02284 family)
MRSRETLDAVPTHLQHERGCDDCNEHKKLARINGHCFSYIQFWAICLAKLVPRIASVFSEGVAKLMTDRLPQNHWNSAAKERVSGTAVASLPWTAIRGNRGSRAIFDYSKEVHMSTNIVSVLNDLVETSKDGEKGFRKAAEDTKDVTLKQLFTGRAEDCARGANELQDVVQRLGGKPQTGGTVGGALHRGWVDIKSAVTHRSDHAILEECERGEDVAKKNYRDALDKELPADVRAVVERQYQGVIENHDRIRDLRDQYAAAKP